jgi:DUF971 family protein
VTESPSALTANKSKRELTLNWKDGHVSIYPFGLLRSACPCATCRGGHENMRSEPDPEVFDRVVADSAATRLTRIEAVGQYAITIEWEDGHHYGIYNWHFLRALCPCAECRGLDK